MHTEGSNFAYMTQTTLHNMFLQVGLPVVFLVDRFYSSTFAYTLATCMEGDEEAVEEVKMILMLENFLIERWLVGNPSFSSGQKI